jgi:hypothetical protein
VEVHYDAPRRPVREPLGPLDDDDAARRQVGIQADVVELGTIEAVEIEVDERQPPAGVLVDEREGRAGHFAGIEAQPLGQALHEYGLAGAEIAVQQHDGTSAQRVGKVTGNRARPGFVVRDVRRRAGHSLFGSTRARAVSSCTASPMWLTMSPATMATSPSSASASSPAAPCR